ncbi:MAG TPA: YtxH domain-containing protein [Thermodesulfovibrionales bacterium]|nr:YtxH domain-containing protein [Thermodesulfovibrionales bacterium]
MTATHGTRRGSFAGLFLGGLVGAGVALVAAPRSGKETRQRINGFAEDVKGRAVCYARRAKEKATSAAEKGKDFVREKRSLLTTAIEAGREAYAKETLRRTHSCEGYEKGAGTF